VRAEVARCAATALPLEAERFLAAVRRHLHGLPDDERDELLDDLATHLAEVTADDDRPLEQVLGSPEAFAAELLASAGVGSAAGSTGTSSVAGSLRRAVGGRGAGDAHKVAPTASRLAVTGSS